MDKNCLTLYEPTLTPHSWGCAFQLHCWVFIDRVHATTSLAALAEATWTVLKSPCNYITKKTSKSFYCSCTPHVATPGCSENPVCWESWLLQNVLWFVLLSCQWLKDTVSLRTLLWFTYVPDDCLLGMVDNLKFGWILPAEVQPLCFLCSKPSEAPVYHLVTCNNWNKWEQTQQDNFCQANCFPYYTL